MSQIVDSIQNIQLLEYKLHQDTLALNKILKWEKSIKKRIESAKIQIQILKKERPKQEPISKIPIQIQSDRKFRSQQEKELKSNSANNLRLTQLTEIFHNSTSLTESSSTSELLIIPNKSIKKLRKT
ncbi:unnamed protein product [Brachionus calyciflorus]|uniref:Uncharacterized protein n=1 Tax=Brachionus calyciflorus TaxID=104777 RepID=A0A814LZH8_9BILA|nr:unnamed protein product [Brachionus calyciflorus]